MNKIVNIVVVIDTASLIAANPNPSQNSSKPTTVPSNCSYAFAPTECTRLDSAEGLKIRANVGDVIRWWIKSESNNFESSVLGYEIVQARIYKTLGKPVFIEDVRDSMQPTQGGPFPVTFPNQTFWFMQTSIKRIGSSKCKIRFAVYGSPTDGGDQLYGRFQFDQMLTIENEIAD